MNLLEALSVLSKSSKYSVSTLRTETISDEFQSLKDYLYIKPEIQTDFENAINLELESQESKGIICLCGSSGDGKSEILTKQCTHPQYVDRIEFHLDATHSNSQHQSAIDCLDERFDEYKKSGKPLAIGINIGMLQKFIKQGSERHNDIKLSFDKYFDNRLIKGFKFGSVSFFDFECYPRIDFSEKKISSKFISAFLKRLTEYSFTNPFYQYYKAEAKLGSQLAKNYELLRLESFQQRLIELFGLVRLIKEQFLTPRIFVDYIFQILTLDHIDGIIGNVFSVFDNEFSRCFKDFDPIFLRDQDLDNFYLEYSTNTLSELVKKDVEQLNNLSGQQLTSEGVIRGVYLLKGYSFNSYLSNIFERIDLYKALNLYLGLIHLYGKNKLSLNEEDECLKIIEDLLITSVFYYANRMLPSKAEGFIVSRKLSGYSICNKVSVQADVAWIENHELITADVIPIPLIINDQPTYIFNIDLRTIIQAINISNGYRPNRQNIELIAKFDELILKIVESSLNTDSLRIVSDTKTISISKNRNRYMVGV